MSLPLRGVRRKSFDARNKLAAATPPTGSAAPPAPAIVDLPRTRSGTLARALLDAVNSGKDDVLRAFLKEHLGEHALELAPFDDWFSYIRRCSIFAPSPRRSAVTSSSVRR